MEDALEREDARSLVAALRESEAAIDGQVLFSLGERMRLVCDAGVRGDEACSLVTEILRFVDRGANEEGGALPVPTTILDQQNKFGDGLGRALEFLCSDVDEWLGSCDAGEYELCLRKATEFVSMTCGEEGGAGASAYAKGELGRLCIPHFVSLAASPRGEIARARREVLQTVAELVHGCEANAGLVLSLLSDLDHAFLGFLAQCGDYQTQLNYVDIVYRLHRHASKKSNKSDRDCRAFLDQDFGVFGQKKFFVERYKGHDEMKRSSMKLLDAFNAENDACGVHSFKVKSVVLAGSREGCDRASEPKGGAARSHDRVFVGESLMTFSVLVQDEGDLWNETVDVPLRDIAVAEAEEGKRGTWKLYLSVPSDPKRLNPFLEHGSESVVCISGTKKVLAGIKDTCLAANRLSPTGDADDGPSQKISRGIHCSIPCTLEGGKSVPKAPEAKKSQRKVPENFGDEFFVGRALSVWWDGDECYYHGKVSECDTMKGRVHVEYDDGDKEWIDPSKCKIAFDHEEQAKEDPTPRQNGQVGKGKKQASSRKRTPPAKPKASVPEKPKAKPKPLASLKREQERRSSPPTETIRRKRPVKRRIDLLAEIPEHPEHSESETERVNDERVNDASETQDGSSDDEPNERFSDEAWVPEEVQKKRPKMTASKKANPGNKSTTSKAKASIQRQRISRKGSTAPKKRCSPRSPSPGLRFKTGKQAESDIAADMSTLDEPGSSLRHYRISGRKKKDSWTGHTIKRRPPPQPLRSEQSVSLFSLSPEEKESERSESYKEDTSSAEAMDPEIIPSARKPRTWEPVPAGRPKDRRQTSSSKLFGDLESSLVTGGSTGTEAENMAVLGNLIQSIMASRKKKKGRKRKKMEDLFVSKLHGDSKKLEGYVSTAIEESNQFCSDVYSGITKEFDKIDSKMKSCVAAFNKEMQALSRTYSKFLESINTKEREVDSFVQKKVKSARDLTVRARSKAEELMQRTKQKTAELENNKESSHQISQLLNALMANA
ncbi:Tudor domain-containing protein [Chloropicon primus]|uniref:Tudor domain-containing protein n=2 Tax=Chloropicon primus TaxID=1764295 RepID=A0A5B8MF21_9CHLO|nr:hypothetical protein A3770_02p15470 [Chloropicon primus]UPQ98238.1 Tudor domain-containing protein [Chloropicon primus]|eukprot:QDZ19029.1 hypothetical protein A3770_02p15470 [Chloropicon primus]